MLNGPNISTSLQKLVNFFVKVLFNKRRVVCLNCWLSGSALSINDRGNPGQLWGDEKMRLKIICHEEGKKLNCCILLVTTMKLIQEWSWAIGLEYIGAIGLECFSQSQRVYEIMSHLHKLQVLALTLIFKPCKEQKPNFLGATLV